MESNSGNLNQILQFCSDELQQCDSFDDMCGKEIIVISKNGECINYVISAIRFIGFSISNNLTPERKKLFANVEQSSIQGNIQISKQIKACSQITGTRIYPDVKLMITSPKYEVVYEVIDETSSRLDTAMYTDILNLSLTDKNIHDCVCETECSDITIKLSENMITVSLGGLLPIRMEKYIRVLTELSYADVYNIVLNKYKTIGIVLNEEVDGMMEELILLKGDVQLNPHNLSNPEYNLSLKSLGINSDIGFFVVTKRSYECIICSEMIDRSDLFVVTTHPAKCSHIYHTDCISKWINTSNSNECPTCRQHIPLNLCLRLNISDDIIKHICDEYIQQKRYSTYKELVDSFDSCCHPILDLDGMKWLEDPTTNKCPTCGKNIPLETLFLPIFKLTSECIANIIIRYKNANY